VVAVMLPKTLNHSAKTKVGDTNEAGAPARMQQAIALVERSMRPSLVARITAVAPRVLRELQQQIHGCRPAVGQFPRTGGILRSQRSRASAAVFGALYLAFGGAAINAGSDLDALLSASPLPEADRKCCCVPQVGAHPCPYHRSVPGAKVATTEQTLALPRGLRELVHKAEFRVQAAARIAIAGNVIDINVPVNYALEPPLHRATTQPFVTNHMPASREVLARIDQLLLGCPATISASSLSANRDHPVELKDDRSRVRPSRPVRTLTPLCASWAHGVCQSGRNKKGLSGFHSSH